MQLRRYTLDGKLFQAAKGLKDEYLKSFVLDAAKKLRAHRLAEQDAMKAAGLPETANVEFYVGVVGHDATPPADVRELTRLFNLEDPR